MSKREPKKLTPKQERFCEEYMVDMNGTQAILRAGYSMTNNSARVKASIFLRDSRIQEKIKKLRDAQSARTEISADYVLRNLQEVVERCMQRSPVLEKIGKEWVQAKDEEGRHVWKFDANGTNTALNMLGKHLKLFTEKREISGNLTLEDIIAGPAEDEDEED